MRVIDLTLPFGPGNNPRIAFKRIEVGGWAVTQVTFDSDADTHLDAPCHQVPGAPSLDGVELNRCIGPAFVCDLRHVQPREQIEPEDFAPWAERIVPGSRVLYRTEWTARLGEPGYREGFPCPSVRCAEWLAGRGIVMLGMDTPSVGPV